jgi:hypothetical protein
MHPARSKTYTDRKFKRTKLMKNSEVHVLTITALTPYISEIIVDVVVKVVIM